MELEFTSPTQMVGRVRGLRGGELDQFANAQGARSGAIGDKILQACTLEISEPGLLYDDGISPKESNKLITCDRFYLMMMIRIASHGQVYSFPYQCRDCRESYTVDVDLIKGLDVYDFPEESVAIYKNGNAFTAAVGDETITFRILTGEGEVKAQKVLKMAPREKATTSLAQRVTKVVTGDGKELTNRNDIHDWAKNQEIGRRLELIAEMDSVDGGVETEIDVDCPHCGHEERGIDLPLDTREWLAPTKKSATKKRKARQRSPA